MVAIQIRDVPAEVRDRLAEAARARGQSLQAYLLALVTDQARRADNLAVLHRMADRDDGSRLSSQEVADELARLRDDREDQLAQMSRPRRSRS